MAVFFNAFGLSFMSNFILSSISGFIFSAFSFMLPFIIAASYLIIFIILFLYFSNEKPLNIKRNIGLFIIKLADKLKDFAQVNFLEKDSSVQDQQQPSEETEDTKDEIEPEIPESGKIEEKQVSKKEKLIKAGIFSTVIMLLSLLFFFSFFNRNSTHPKINYITQKAGSEAEYYDTDIDVKKTPVNLTYDQPQLLIASEVKDTPTELKVLSRHKVSGVIVEKGLDYSYRSDNLPKMNMLLAWGDLAEKDKIKAITGTLNNVSSLLKEIREENKDIEIEPDNPAYGLVNYLTDEFLVRMSSFYSDLGNLIKENPELENLDLQDNMAFYKVVPGNKELMGQLQGLNPQNKVLLQGYIAEVNSPTQDSSKENDKIFYVTNLKEENKTQKEVMNLIDKYSNY